MELTRANAVVLAAAIRSGEITSEELVGACLARIREVDETVRAWAYLDPDYALEQARRADEVRKSGPGPGPLHGVPVALKDIIDTRDMPTELGTPVAAGRQPSHDAALVARLREAGAVILGKAVTTELACYTPGKTRNPHDPARTPGGSSSGSAAAVAAGMVPLAVGTQTHGSVIRPASFCGVYGFKPTHGTISRHGVLGQSRAFDTVGVFGRSVEDVALLAECLAGFDERDADTRPHGSLRLSAVAAEAPPVRPALAFVRSPVWDRAEEDTRAAFAALVERLGDCDEVELPEPFDRAVEYHRTIFVADLAKSYAGFCERGRDRLSPNLRALIEEGHTVRAVDYNRALDSIEVLNAGLGPIFERYDAIVTPAAPGQAPVGLETTGDPIFCTFWTLCRTPAISLPLLSGSAGMPIGVQMVGPRLDDARLLRTARWLVGRLSDS